MTAPTKKLDAGAMTMTDEQWKFNEWVTDLADPFWLKDAQKEGEFFDANGFARALLSASKPAAQDEREQAYREATKPRPETSGVGEYCQPGDRREPRWIIMYDDADRSLSIFEDEQDARDCFANSEAMGWNCWLFSPTLRVRAASPQAAPFEWPTLPALPNQGFYAFDQALFTEHQMQGHANAYGEAVRAAMAAATQPAQTERALTDVQVIAYLEPLCDKSRTDKADVLRVGRALLAAAQPASGDPQ